MDNSTTNNRACAAVAAAVALIGFAGATQAQVSRDPVDLQVVDRETGQVLPTWRHHGRLFIAGQPGDRYGLRVTNHSESRVLVVMSVDGVNILSGETAGWGQRGYVFDPGESYDLTGWRKSDSEVAAFTFAALPQSYAARTGRSADVGVIGIAVFKEKVAAPTVEWRSPPVVAPNIPAPPTAGWRAPAVVAPNIATPPPLFIRPLGAAKPSASAPPPPPRPVVTADVFAALPAPIVEAKGRSAYVAEETRRDEKLGTAHGVREWSVTYLVPFKRATPYPQFTREIEYNTYANLVASGVIHPLEDAQRHPRPFPSNPQGGGYVPDPPGDP